MRIPRPLRLVLTAAGVALAMVGGHLASAQDVAGPTLVADNAAAAANAGTLVANGLGAASSLSGKTVSLPPGFAISVLASGLKSPRFMAFDDAGSLLVADAGAGRVYRYPATGGAIAPTAQPPDALLSGLNAPSNVALHDGFVYVGETNAVTRYAYDAAGAVGGRETVVPDLPTGGHGTRTVAFGPDGRMFVGVGSSCNICDERDERRAAVLRYAPDGSGYERFAWGLRNPVGLAIQPGTGLLWATVNERDNQGNEIPPDLVTTVSEGQNFGWPACQPPNATPQDAGNDCFGVTPPTVAIQAHGAPLGLAFYQGPQLPFPSDYAGDLFVVQHGSWDRQPPAPPKIMRIHFDGALPSRVQDFATGWQSGDGSRWGRPAGIVVAPDGGLVVSDDTAGVLYRISYAG